MNFEQTITKFCEKYNRSTMSFIDKLAFVESQWGMFCTWIKEDKHLK